jgi:hypothetical protein
MNRFIFAVDLGKLSDPTAFSILDEKYQRSAHPTPHDIVIGHEGRVKVDRLYHLRYLARPPLRTSYIDLVDRINNLMHSAELAGNTDLVVDATGVGQPVVDMMIDIGLRPIAVSITGGNTVTRAESGHIGHAAFNVPKKDIAGALQVMFGKGWIKVPKDMALVPEFLEEMAKFCIKITKAENVTYEALRASDHDDLVLSVGIGAWWALFSRGSSYTRDMLEDKEKQEPYNPRDYLLTDSH